MRLTRSRLAVPLILLVFAGCGGTAVVVNNVPGGPVDLQVPGSGEGLPGARATATASATATETPAEGAATTTETPAAGTSEPQAETQTQTTPNNGSAEALATDPNAGTAEAPQPGAPKEDFEDYCAQNPGAC